jgi:hypothetical protein
VLSVACSATQNDVTEAATRGISILASANSFEDRKDPKDYSRDEARAVLQEAARAATLLTHNRADVLASLMSDVAIKTKKEEHPGTIDPTPFCLLFGQGRQHFFERLVKVSAELTPPQRNKSSATVALSTIECLAQTLFTSWHRSDPLEFSSFRWDPEEARRYALLPGNPSDTEYKGGTQLGANRLAIIGLPALTLAPETRVGRVRPIVLGGSFGPEGFAFSWPIWKEPATLSAIRVLIGHPDLRKTGALAHLSVDHVLTAKRISVGKFMNFTRARIQST